MYSVTVQGKTPVDLLAALLALVASMGATPQASKVVAAVSETKSAPLAAVVADEPTPAEAMEDIFGGGGAESPTPAAATEPAATPAAAPAAAGQSEAEARRARRAARKAAAAATAPAAEPVAAAAAAPAATPAPAAAAAGPVTVETLRALAMPLIKANKHVEVKAALTKLGVETLTACPPDKFAAVHKAILAIK